MTDLTEFLLARIKADELAVGLAGRGPGGTQIWNAVDWPEAPRGARAWRVDRILAECEAKRRIVASRPAIGLPGRELNRNTLAAVHEEVERQREHVFRLLALPYSEHPDYRAEWRP